jgi:lycopene beta-cyclase
MTYFQFLLVFLGIPLILLLFLTALDKRKGWLLVYSRQRFPVWLALWVHVLVAVVYTTPWDNYLVATGVWYYNPKLVSGITLGWVPLEEYIFFILQTLMTGLFFLAVARRIRMNKGNLQSTGPWRFVAVLVLGIVWIFAVILIISGWSPATYLGLILIWACPPIMMQFLFGGDILWQERKIICITLILSTLYLSITDSLAIGSGTWTIDPNQSLQVFLGGVLPVEEFLFFLVTNCLIVFGVTLLLSRESRNRLLKWIGKTSSTKITNEQQQTIQ